MRGSRTSAHKTVAAGALTIFNHGGGVLAVDVMD